MADALDVAIGDLVGEPTLLDWTDDSGVNTVPALRAALMDYSQLAPLLGASNADDEPVSLDNVERDVAQAFDAYQASRYAYVTARVPLILNDALRAARTADVEDFGRAQGLLALTYQVAVSVLTKLGETDLAWIASERGLTAAQKVGQPRRSRIALPIGRPRLALDGSVRSQRRPHPRRGRTSSSPSSVRRADDALLSVYGTLFLTGAVAAARADDRAAARSFLDEAQRERQPARARPERHVDRVRAD